MRKKIQPTGMKAFTIAWAGQFVSQMGSIMTGFALTFWAYEVTGQATALALVGFFSFGPTILLSPIAGALVDRWNRKAILIMSDLAAALSSVAVLILHLTGHLEVWHLYVTGFFSGVFQSFQYPAWRASVTLIVPKEQYTRTSGMMGLTGSASGIIAPVLAGLLLGIVGVRGVLVIDIATFFVAVATLAIVHIPQLPETAEKREVGNLFEDVVYGFRYISARRGLLTILLIIAIVNLLANIHNTLFRPMILARTGSDQMILAAAQSAASFGGVAGGLIMTAWGNPKRKMYVMLTGYTLATAFQAMMGLSQGVIAWVVVSFTWVALISVGLSVSNAIWQSKVAPEVQGRVLAIRRMIAQTTNLVALLAAGPLADRIFEPAMMSGSWLANTFGGLFGTGPGAGMGVLIFFGCGLGALAMASGYAFPSVRNIETDLPDYDAVVIVEPVSSDKQPQKTEKRRAEAIV